MKSALTISQLAAYAGVTVRAVRHYHTKGLLPEPERDHSGYRRYDAAAVIALIKIRTLADAGVPLARVKDLLAADEEAFAAAVADIDRQLQAEIREREEHRRRIAQLAAGDSLALPPEAVAYLERSRELGFPDRLIEIERDSWILIAAQLPEHIPELMSLKRAQINDPTVAGFYRELGEAVDWDADDPRLIGIVDRFVAYVEEASEQAVGIEEPWQLDMQLVALLDDFFLQNVPIATRLLELLEERGWRGWTDMQPVEPSA